MHNTGHKILLIGLDGATFNVIKPFIEEGLLPNIASLMRNGSHGILQSTVPPISPPGWATFMTGKNPGKHGVLQFLKINSTIDRVKESVCEPKIVNYNSIKATTIFDIFRETDKKIVSINLPMTYPPPETNGCVISCWLTPPKARDFTFPKELVNELDGYRIDQYFGGDNYATVPEGTEQPTSDFILKDLGDVLEKRTTTALRFMKTKEWDLFIICFTETDRMQHAFWRAINPSYPAYSSPEIQREREGFKDLYRKIDAAIGELARAAGDNTLKIIVSDHGFGPPPTKRIYFNHWLINNGYFKVSRKWYKSIAKLVRDSRPFRYSLQLIPGTAFSGIRRVVRERFSEIDWNNITAWSINLHNNWGAIYINHKGRSENGLVSEGTEYELVRGKIIDGLKNLNTSNQQGLILEIYTNEQLYAGPFATEFPDIIFKVNPDYETGSILGLDTSMTELISTVPPYPDGKGNHQREGIYILSGDVFNANRESHSRSIDCILPTLLYLLGIPIPNDCDGNVLAECIRENYLSLHRIQYQNALTKLTNEGNGLSDNQDDIRTKLKDLGYLS